MIEKYDLLIGVCSKHVFLFASWMTIHHILYAINLTDSDSGLITILITTMITFVVLSSWQTVTKVHISCH